MKALFASIVLMGLTAGAFGLISLRGAKQMIIEKKDRRAIGAIPPVDAQLPGRIETATFALG